MSADGIGVEGMSSNVLEGAKTHDSDRRSIESVVGRLKEYEERIGPSHADAADAGVERKDDDTVARRLEDGLPQGVTSSVLASI